MTSAQAAAGVVVVGAGPVGLLLSCELARARVPVVVVERLAQPMTESRASQLSTLSAELLHERGFDELLGEATPEPRAHFAGLGFDLTDPSGRSGLDSEYAGYWKVPQYRTEALLSQRAEGLGVTVLRAHELTEITELEDHVVLGVRGPDGPLRTQARYVVGCDGARSSVRRLCGFSVSGTQATQELLRADLRGVEIRDRRFERLAAGFAVAATRDGVTRVMVHAPDQRVAHRRGPPTFDEVVRLWEKVTGEDISGGDAIWLDAFDNSMGQAAAYRRGRVLLAGDAAHWHMPIGGQALNVGLQDAVNLGWKLAGMVNGWAAPGLLDSYHDERHPVATRVLNHVAAQELLLLGGAEAEPLRAVLAELIGLGSVRAHLARVAGNLDERYGRPGSPLIGRRVTNLRLRTESGPLPTANTEPVLVRLTPPPDNLARPTVATIHARDDVGALPGITTVLLRPDGYIAWAGDDEESLDQAIEKLYVPKEGPKMSGFDADVIIVGAGPTGLMLAGELGLAGVETLVLDRLSEPMQQSRALGFSARTIEEFDQRGLLPRFGDLQTIPVGHFGGLPIDFRVLEGGSYGARGKPQSLTEAVLHGWATEQGAVVQRDHEVTGLRTDDDGVELDVLTPQGGQRLRARYVAGCDGGRSSVRKLAGIDFPGTEPTIEMWFADVAGCNLRPRFSGERVPGGMVMVLPMGPQINRVVVYERGRTRQSEGPPTFEEVAAAWNRLTGEDISAAKPQWTSWTTDASRQAAQYRQGRVLLLGDAAHIHLPVGAQGMSAGVGDAMNLGWKLGAEINGHAPAGLLDTYHTERHPVGARILANTLAQRILYLSGDELDPMRAVMTELLAYEEVQKLLVGMVTGLDIRYDVGAGDHPLLGRRLPNLGLRGDFGSSGTANAFRFLNAGRGVLVDLGGDDGLRAAAEAWADRVDVVTTTSRPHGALTGVEAALVRPDGYIAWIGTGESGTAGLPDALARWFGQPHDTHQIATPAVAGARPHAR